MPSGKWRPFCLDLNVLRSLPHIPGTNELTKKVPSAKWRPFCLNELTTLSLAPNHATQPDQAERIMCIFCAIYCIYFLIMVNG